ncbi:MAG: hypothetical protein ACYDCO_28325, partial [Armatimonadota bacterium]
LPCAEGLPSKAGAGRLRAQDSSQPSPQHSPQILINHQLAFFTLISIDALKNASYNGIDDRSYNHLRRLTNGT